MKEKSIKINYKDTNGFALIFTILIVSVISIVSSGLINSSFKQKILSSLAKDSQIAFYQADTAGDCALYGELIASQEDLSLFTIKDNTWTCGGYKLTIDPVEDGSGSYRLSLPELSNSMEPCIDIRVIKTPSGTPGSYDTLISAKGYNICNKNNPRTVEREIQINYTE